MLFSCCEWAGYVCFIIRLRYYLWKPSKGQSLPPYVVHYSEDNITWNAVPYGRLLSNSWKWMKKDGKWYIVNKGWGRLSLLKRSSYQVCIIYQDLQCQIWSFKSWNKDLQISRLYSKTPSDPSKIGNKQYILVVWRCLEAVISWLILKFVSQSVLKVKDMADIAEPKLIAEPNIALPKIAEV